MNCINHPDREATGMCAYSGKPYCSEDLVEVEGKMYAKVNLDKVFGEVKSRSIASASGAPMVFMNSGGASSSSSASASASSSGLDSGFVEKRINHPLHIILSILTGGLWLFVYIPMLMKRPKYERVR